MTTTKLQINTSGDCQECGTSWTLNPATHEVTYEVPSNGVRGRGHVAAHTITVGTADDGTFSDRWDCPVPTSSGVECGYAESEGWTDEEW